MLDGRTDEWAGKMGPRVLSWSLLLIEMQHIWSRVVASIWLWIATHRNIWGEKKETQERTEPKQGQQQGIDQKH